jgi:parallel beta-helix repeat protein
VELRTFLLQTLCLTLLAIASGACRPEAGGAIQTAARETAAPAEAGGTPTPSQTQTAPPSPVLPGETITVTTAADDGPGSLRQALTGAAAGDVIEFDTSVFPPAAPATIHLTACLPSISQGNLTIDASNAGVILDGRAIEGEFCSGLEVVSDSNTIRGLRFEGFASGAGVALSGGAQHNWIGGDPAIGSGPLGQGNLVAYGDLGIGAWGRGTSDNILAGNFLGTDPSGADLGNTGSGVRISEGATNTVIGPLNAIAFNDGFGVAIAGSSGNTITRNSIHGNAQGEIRVVLQDSAASSTPPIILDFDLAAGRAAGAACPGCLVEIFSENAVGGQVFEGQAAADEDGNFSLIGDAPFSGLRLTATATDAEGNTSQFSSGTTGPSSHLVLQQGNSLPRMQVPSAPSASLQDNRMGEMFGVRCQGQSEAETSSYFNMLNDLGLTWARLSLDRFDWPDIEQTGDYSEYRIGECERGAIELLHESGIQIVYALVYWDPAIELHPGYTRFQTEEEINRFLDYARFIARELRGQIDWYEILNEPNAAGDDQRHVLVGDYLRLVRQVIPVLREVDPQAGVIVGNVTPLNGSGSYDYLMEILSADDVMSAADGIAWHGSSGLSLEYQPDFYNSYPGWVDDIVATSQAHGFRGRFFVDELHWRTRETPQPIHGMPWFYTNSVAAKYYARGIVSHLGRGMNVGIGHEGWEGIPEVMRVVHSLTTLMAGAAPAQVPVTLETAATDVQTYSFTLPDGTVLIALWRDGLAVDDDPGIPATLTVPAGPTAQVSAIDVLYGVEQPMLTRYEDGGLAVPGLLLRDYPVFLRLEERAPLP